MLALVRSQYEAFPDPSPARVPVGSGPLDRIDDGLHFGWSWHRHRYCYRRAEGLRILDAGCGTGVSTLGLARLNPASSVLGIDASPRSLAIARERAGAVASAGVEFRELDLDQPLQGAGGPFDFIVCRGVLGQSESPERVLKHLTGVLDHRGLLYATLPARTGRQAARQLRQAVDALAGPGRSLEERAAIALDLFRTLRPDHPIRRYESGYSGEGLPTLERVVAGYLNEAERDWTLVEAVELLGRCGLQFLFAATRRPWRADRALVSEAASDRLKAQVESLAPERLAVLIDALDPALHADEYRLYACLADYEPRAPRWIDERSDRPETFDGLIPHPTGLAWPDATAPSVSPGRVVYRTVTGAIGELDSRADLLLRAADGVRSCGRIVEQVARQTGSSEPSSAWQERWIDLANNGFVLLEPPDQRERIDCRHLGTVLDRLDCACPRRWVRSCEVHGHCTIAEVGPDDAKHASLADALSRLKLFRIASCARCPDYVPDE